MQKERIDGLPDETQEETKNVINDQRDITVTILSNISGFPSFNVNIPLQAKIKQLKEQCASVNFKLKQYIYIYNGTELKNDDLFLSDYGITNDCTIRVVGKMEAGRQTMVMPAMDISQLILFSPLLLPETTTSMAKIKKAILKLQNEKKSPPLNIPANTTQEKTNKNLDLKKIHERIKELLQNQDAKRKQVKLSETQSSPQHFNKSMTLNKIKNSYRTKTDKELLKRKDKKKSSLSLNSGKNLSEKTAVEQSSLENNATSSNSSLAPSLHSSSSLASSMSKIISWISFKDASSVCGSISHSPTPSLSTEAIETNTKDSSTKKETLIQDVNAPVTIKELSSYFYPPETKEEFKIMHRTFYDPPQNRKELEKVKLDMNLLCGVCRRRLPVVVSSIVCACGASFCSRHRDNHNCNVDYKQIERAQIERQNPKIIENEIRKGHSSDF